MAEESTHRALAGRIKHPAGQPRICLRGSIEEGGTPRNLGAGPFDDSWPSIVPARGQRRRPVGSGTVQNCVFLDKDAESPIHSCAKACR
jgi:hypothetical protein